MTLNTFRKRKRTLGQERDSIAKPRREYLMFEPPGIKRWCGFRSCAAPFSKVHVGM